MPTAFHGGEQELQPHFELVIEGNPVGFTATARRNSWNKRALAATSWKKLIQAELERLYGADALPCRTGSAWHVVSHAYFCRLNHCDPENAHKLAKDALFYRSGGPQDKVTSGSYAPPLRDRERPRLVLQGWWYRWDY